MFLGRCLTKSEASLLPKRRPFLGRKRGSGLLTCLSGKVFAWLLLQRGFSKVNFYTIEVFGEVGQSQLLCVNWLSSVVWCVLRGRTQQLSRGGLLFLSEATSGCAAFIIPQGSLSLQWWAITPYFCLISKAHCSSWTAPFFNSSVLDAWVWASLSSALTSPARPPTHTTRRWTQEVWLGDSPPARTSCSCVPPVCAATCNAQLVVGSQGEAHGQLGLLQGSGQEPSRAPRLLMPPLLSAWRDAVWRRAAGATGTSLLFTWDIQVLSVAWVFIYLAKWITFRNVMICLLIFFWTWRGSRSPKYEEDTYLTERG